MHPFTEFLIKQKHAWLKDELDRIGWPEVVASNKISGSSEKRNRPTFSKAMACFGYERQKSDMKDGRFIVEGERTMVYKKLPSAAKQEEN
jgi:hypothetical protein